MCKFIRRIYGVNLRLIPTFLLLSPYSFFTPSLLSYTISNPLITHTTHHYLSHHLLTSLYISHYLHYTPITLFLLLSHSPSPYSFITPSLLSYTISNPLITNTTHHYLSHHLLTSLFISHYPHYTSITLFLLLPHSPSPYSFFTPSLLSYTISNPLITHTTHHYLSHHLLTSLYISHYLHYTPITLFLLLPHSPSPYSFFTPSLLSYTISNPLITNTTHHYLSHHLLTSLYISHYLHYTPITLFLLLSHSPSPYSSITPSLLSYTISNPLITNTTHHYLSHHLPYFPLHLSLSPLHSNHSISTPFPLSLTILLLHSSSPLLYNLQPSHHQYYTPLPLSSSSNFPLHLSLSPLHSNHSISTPFPLSLTILIFHSSSPLLYNPQSFHHPLLHTTISRYLLLTLLHLLSYLYHTPITLFLPLSHSLSPHSSTTPPLLSLTISNFPIIHYTHNYLSYSLFTPFYLPPHLYHTPITLYITLSHSPSPYSSTTLSLLSLTIPTLPSPLLHTTTFLILS